LSSHSHSHLKPISSALIRTRSTKNGSEPLLQSLYNVAEIKQNISKFKKITPLKFTNSINNLTHRCYALTLSGPILRAVELLCISAASTHCYSGFTTIKKKKKKKQRRKKCYWNSYEAQKNAEVGFLSGVGVHRKQWKWVNGWWGRSPWCGAVSLLPLPWQWKTQLFLCSVYDSATNFHFLVFNLFCFVHCRVICVFECYLSLSFRWVVGFCCNLERRLSLHRY